MSSRLHAALPHRMHLTARGACVSWAVTIWRPIHCTTSARLPPLQHRRSCGPSNLATRPPPVHQPHTALSSCQPTFLLAQLPSSAGSPFATRRPAHHAPGQAAALGPLRTCWGAAGRWAGGMGHRHTGRAGVRLGKGGAVRAGRQRGSGAAPAAVVLSEACGAAHQIDTSFLQLAALQQH